MPYCTLADLQSRFGPDEIARISDRAVPRKGAADADVVSAAIAQADAEIDGYLGVVLTLPLASTPELVKNLSCVISRYRLHENQATERVAEDYKDAVRMLRDISAGRLSLSVASVKVPTSAVVVKAPAVVFTDALLSLT